MPALPSAAVTVSESPSGSEINDVTSIVCELFSVTDNVLSAATGVSFVSVIVTVTVAVSVRPDGSVTVYTKLSLVPGASPVGVYVITLPTTLAVPALPSATVTVSESPSASEIKVVTSTVPTEPSVAVNVPLAAAG